MQDVESVREAQGELPVVMGILKVLAFFHVQKGGRHKPSHRALWISVGLWILADQKAPKAFALSRLSFCEQKDRIRQRSKPLSMPYSVQKLGHLPPEWEHVVNWAAWVGVLVHVLSTSDLRAHVPAQFTWQALLRSSILSAFLWRQF